MRKEWLLSLSGLLFAVQQPAYAACTPALDCAELGYKYSSSECAGVGVRCPFNTSK